MVNKLIVIFLCILALGYFMNDRQKSQVEESVVAGAEKALDVLDYVKSTLDEFNVDTSFKSTRDPEWQAEYERASLEFNRTHPTLPPGLVLPDGKTVREHLGQ